jgi:hypothetical protein
MDPNPDPDSDPDPLEVRIRGSGSAPNCHGSPTPAAKSKVNFFRWRHIALTNLSTVLADSSDFFILHCICFYVVCSHRRFFTIQLLLASRRFQQLSFYGSNRKNS